MLKINRTTEYGLLALSYMRRKNAGELTSAREVADYFSLPFEILAKTLQRLKDRGVISSTYGTRGGYVLARDLSTVDLSDFLVMMEGPVSVVACMHRKNGNGQVDHSNCEYGSHCDLKPIMALLNQRMHDFLHRISLEELTRSSGPAPAIPRTERQPLDGQLSREEG